jgi:hypothetical protein
MQVLECFLGTTVSPTTAGQAQAIQQILSLNVSCAVLCLISTDFSCQVKAPMMTLP